MDYIIQKTERKVKLKKRSSPIPISVKSIHNEKMTYFENLQTVILPKKLKELEKLKKEKYCDQYKIKTLLEEIDNIKSRNEEIDYFLKTCKILDEYFLLDSGLQKEDLEDNNCKNNKEYRKTEVIREYYTVLDISLPKEYQPNLYENASYCENCKTNNFIVETNAEGLVCRNCGYIPIRSNISGELSYKDKQFVEHTVVLDYKRVDYFKQWLNQIQAKEQTDIPREVIDTLLVQLKTERINNTSKITSSLIKRLLKKTNNSKYYEHIPYIINIINKVPPLNIPEYIEHKLIAMFEEIQLPWENLKTKDRKNFFSYPYTLHKFCQILGLHEYLSYFPLLKSREKLYKQDVIWKRIMEHFQTNECVHPLLKDIKWVYISSF